MGIHVFEYELFRGSKFLVAKSNEDRVVSLFNERGFESKLLHSLECGVKSFTNVFVGSVGELVHQAHKLRDTLNKRYF